VGMSAGGGAATTRFCARGEKKPLAISLNPEKAYKAYFSIAAGGDLKKQFHLKRNLLDYMIDDVKAAQNVVGSRGKEELDAYLDAFDSLSKRQYALLDAEKQISTTAPRRDDRFESSDPVKRMEAQFEIATSALIGGLTHVATVSCAAGEIHTKPYTSLGVDLTTHSIGHSGGNRRNAKGIPYYEKTRSFVMGLIANMMERLEAVPEGAGSMMDNTLIIYMSDAPDTHHSTAKEWPLLLAGDLGGRLKLGGQYINYPGYGKPGHRTVGSFYTTLLNLAGVQQKSFGMLDPDLDEAMQTGPCVELLS
ncbi:MAG: DUF1552 domain-containing protein, partial [Verrucomicrobiota bacterium]